MINMPLVIKKGEIKLKMKNMIKLGICLCLAAGISSQPASAEEAKVQWTTREAGYSIVSLVKDGIEYNLVDCKEDKYADYAIIVGYSDIDVPENGVVVLPSEVRYQDKIYPIAGADAQSSMPDRVQEVVVPADFGKVEICLPGNLNEKFFDRDMGKGERNFFSLPNVPKVTVKAKKISISNIYWEDGKIDKLNEGNNRLERIVLESERIYMSKYALANMKNLKEISIKADSSLTMEMYSIINCDKLKKLSLPAKMNYHEGAIVQCDALNALKATDGGKYHSKKGALYSNDTLLFAPAGCVSFQVGADVKRIGKLAFANCSKLKKVNSSVAEIGDGAFLNCGKLSQVKLKKTKSIGSYAFTLTAIRKIMLPATLKKMGYGVFYRAESLKSIKSRGKYFRVKNNSLISQNGKQLYAVISNSGKITVPNGVKKIYALAISNPAKVREITLPTSLKKSGALGKCNRLKKITFQGKKPPVYTHSFSDIYDRELTDLFDGEWYLIESKQKVTVFIPKSSGKRYQKYLKERIYSSRYKNIKIKCFSKS